MPFQRAPNTDRDYAKQPVRLATAEGEDEPELCMPYVGDESEDLEEHGGIGSVRKCHEKDRLSISD